MHQLTGVTLLIGCKRELMKVIAVTPEHEKKWRDLSRQAMRENDVNKLLEIFLELDRLTEQEQRRTANTLESAGRQVLGQHSETR